MTLPLLGSDGWDEITNNAGAEVAGCYYSNHYSPDADDPEVRNFVNKYRARHHITPNALAALGYDATYILAEAIERSGSTAPERVKAALFRTDRKFVTGRIKFDGQGNPVKPAIMLKVVRDFAGKLRTEYAGTVNP